MVALPASRPTSLPVTALSLPGPSCKSSRIWNACPAALANCFNGSTTLSPDPAITVAMFTATSNSMPVLSSLVTAMSSPLRPSRPARKSWYCPMARPLVPMALASVELMRVRASAGSPGALDTRANARLSSEMAARIATSSPKRT